MQFTASCFNGYSRKGQKANAEINAYEWLDRCDVFGCHDDSRLEANARKIFIDELARCRSRIKENHGISLELVRIHEHTAKTTLFVTHDLDEAIYLSDRVVVLAARPGRVKKIIDVPFAHPRPELAELRNDARFQEIRREMWSLIRTSETVAA